MSYGDYSVVTSARIDRAVSLAQEMMLNSGPSSAERHARDAVREVFGPWLNLEDVSHSISLMRLEERIVLEVSQRVVPVSVSVAA